MDTPLPDAGELVKRSEAREEDERWGDERPRWQGGMPAAWRLFGKSLWPQAVDIAQRVLSRRRIPEGVEFHCFHDRDELKSASAIRRFLVFTRKRSAANSQTMRDAASAFLA